MDCSEPGPYYDVSLLQIRRHGARFTCSATVCAGRSRKSNTPCSPRHDHYSRWPAPRSCLSVDPAVRKVDHENFVREDRLVPSRYCGMHSGWHALRVLLTPRTGYGHNTGHHNFRRHWQRSRELGDRDRRRCSQRDTEGAPPRD